MNNYKDRLIQSNPVFGDMLSSQGFMGQQLVTGAVAGDVAVSGVLVGDELVSVINLTDLTDVTSEFIIRADGKINNADGTSTATKAVLVTFIKWEARR